MYKIIFTFLISIVFITTSFSQQTSVFYSGGGIYSKINPTVFDKESTIQPITGKHNIYNSIGFRHSFIKFLDLELIFTYQERLPLENFTFTGMSFSEVPTSPQSDNWNPEHFLRLPNFNYFHLECIPMVSIINRHIKVSAGLGFYYGSLLNQKEVTFTRSDFPVLEYFFDSTRFNVGGEVSYRKIDFGWIPKFAISVPLSAKMELGLSSKLYVSESALLSENFGEKSYGRKLNETWLVFAYGLEVSYLLDWSRLGR